jgi:hypothetical protein
MLQNHECVKYFEGYVLANSKRSMTGSTAIRGTIVAFGPGRSTRDGRAPFQLALCGGNRADAGIRFS